MDGLGSLLSLPKGFALSMKRQPKYRWWKPLIALILAAVLSIIFIIIVHLTFNLISNLTGFGAGSDFRDAVSANKGNHVYVSTAESDVLVLASTFMSIAIFIPAVGIASKIMGLGGLRSLSSVEGGLRWDRIRSLFGWPLMVVAIISLANLAYSAITQPDGLGELRFSAIVIIVTLLLCPLQCAGEEYLCRGLMLQAFSSWVPIVIIPIIVQAAIFTAMHGYNSLGLVSTFFFGLCTAFLALKTGGLEAPICMHVANNVVSLIIGSLFVAAETTTQITPGAFALDVFNICIMTAILYWQCKRKGYLLEQRKQQLAEQE